MNRSLTLLASALLPLGLLGAAAPTSSATPVGLMTSAQVGEVYPRFTDGERVAGPGPLPAPSEAGGCDSTRSFSAPRQRFAAFVAADPKRRPWPQIHQYVLRYTTVAEADAVLRQYRDYLAACSGSRRTTANDGAPAEALVRDWGAARVGAASVSMIDRLAYSDVRQWTGTLVARVGTSVTVVEVVPSARDRKPRRHEVVRLTRVAASHLG